MRNAHSDLDYLLFGGGGNSGLAAHSAGMPKSVAAKLLSAMMAKDPYATSRVLRTNEVLNKDEWVQYDQAVIQIARARLNTVRAFTAAGLTYNLPNALGHTVIQWGTVGDFDPAEISMDAVTRAQKDKPDRKIVSMPVPIIHKEFMVSIRELAASRNGNTPLDTTMAELAARRVADRVESIIWAGVTMGNVAGGQVYGLLTAPSRNTVALGTNGAWSASAKTGADILADVQTILKILRGKHMFGPYKIFIPADAETAMDGDYKSGTSDSRTIRERLEAIDAIGRGGIVVSDTLPTGNIVGMQMTKDVFDLVIGMQPTTVQWETLGGLEQNFKVMAIILPRVKADYSSQSGVVHMS